MDVQKKKKKGMAENLVGGLEKKGGDTVRVKSELHFKELGVALIRIEGT